MPDVWIERTRSFMGTAVAVWPADEPVVVQVPELEIHESYLEILDRHSGQAVVTVIEVVSPTNKFPGPGRVAYLTKQREVRNSTAHLVEIDLLRAGQHELAVPEWVARGRGPYDYLVSVNRSATPRDKFDLYAKTVRQRLPRIHIPLADCDPDVTLDLQSAIEQTYDAGSYRGRISYASPCVPPLAVEDQAWAAARVSGQGG